LENIDPFIIHYHWMVDECGLLKHSRFKRVDERVAQFNEALVKERKRAFDNRIFWDFRYSCHSEIGSSTGLRSDYGERKRQLLGRIVERIKPESILDIGCGDMRISSVLPVEGYIGLDVSKVIIEANRKKHPERQFIHGNFLDLKLQPADLTICLDLLIHLSGKEEYQKTVRKLVELTRREGIVSGFEERISSSTGTVFYHEPLSDTLRAAGAGRLRQILRNDDIVTFSFQPLTRRFS